MCSPYILPSQNSTRDHCDITLWCHNWLLYSFSGKTTAHTQMKCHNSSAHPLASLPKCPVTIATPEPYRLFLIPKLEPKCRLLTGCPFVTCVLSVIGYLCTIFTLWWTQVHKYIYNNNYTEHLGRIKPLGLALCLYCSRVLLLHLVQRRAGSCGRCSLEQTLKDETLLMWVKWVFLQICYC